MLSASVGTPALWAGFLLFVLLMLALDLGVFHRKSHVIGMREAALWSAMWVSLALIFNAGVYHWFGRQKALEFLTGYVIEKALSVDNLFVFLVIFSYFKVAAIVQHRVLFWGILGALVMRAAFILAGGALLTHFSWTVYVFGAILLVTGLKLLVQSEEDVHPERNPVVRLAARLLPIDATCSGLTFTARRNGRLVFTPLFLALITVEISDVVFAVDSIPAVFAVTRDPFIVFTSNIFAILGLRSLYFLLASAMTRFHYLRLGLAIILLFVGAKMIVVKFYHVPTELSLAVIATVLASAVIASLVRNKRQAARAGE